MKITTNAYMGVESLVRLAMCSRQSPRSAQRMAEWINHSVSYTDSLLARLRAAGAGER
ncbi:MAG: DNA-binding IscR family transcriptional regulator [Paracoccaceae bacterium]|jgi:DNA-binding IscR family transcriptional regulator